MDEKGEYRIHGGERLEYHRIGMYVAVEFRPIGISAASYFFLIGDLSRKAFPIAVLSHIRIKNIRIFLSYRDYIKLTTYGNTALCSKASVLR